MKSLVACSVIALTLGASAPSFAADEPQPLPVVANKPIALAPPASHPGGGWIALATLAAAGVGAWSWRKTRTQARASESSRLRVVTRATIGSRSELVIVDAGGQRLLLGVAPGGITTLATLDDLDEPAREAAPSPAAAPRGEPRRPETRPPESLRARLDAMIDSAADAPVLRKERVHAARSAPADDFAIEGQARGLLSLGRGR